MPPAHFIATQSTLPGVPGGKRIVEPDENTVDLDSSSNSEEDTGLTIKDQVGTLQPTTNHHDLLRGIRYLSQKTCDVLAQDLRRRKRYATKLVFTYRLKGGIREELEVKLPLTCDTWNELEELDVRLQILYAISDMPNNFSWYRLQIRAVSFMSEETKRAIEVMDEEDSCRIEPTPRQYAKPTPGTGPSSMLSSTPQSGKKIENITSSCSSSNVDPIEPAPKPKPEPQSNNKTPSEDNDSDVEVVYEHVTKKQKVKVQKKE